MNRPKLEDFYNQGKFYKVSELVPIYVNMIEALDKYCDELEKKNDYCKDCSHCSLWWKDEYVDSLEKALDKACDLIWERGYKWKEDDTLDGHVSRCYTRDEIKEDILKVVED